MTEKAFVKARAPAKIILSGEHAVVYGQPALAMAINRYTESIVRWSTPFHFTFNLLGIDFKQKMTLEALKRIKRKLNKQYQQFSSGYIHIRDVLKHPMELTLYTAINVIDKLKHNLPMGIDFDSNSNIPIGSGLGSSAACVVSMITALSEFLELKMDIEDYIRLGIESENLQHGFSSGIDVHISYRGGCSFYQNGVFSSRPIPKFPMQLVFTGQPKSSTGECVTHAKATFEKSQIADDFSAVTRALDQAMTENNLNAIKEAINENHLLLKKLSVVPQKADDFIQAVKNEGNAAKICGAGSIAGDAAGVILVAGDNDISTLIDKYSYQRMPVSGDANGAIILQS